MAPICARLVRDLVDAGPAREDELLAHFPFASWARLAPETGVISETHDGVSCFRLMTDGVVSYLFVQIILVSRGVRDSLALDVLDSHALS